MIDCEYNEMHTKFLFEIGMCKSESDWQSKLMDFRRKIGIELFGKPIDFILKDTLDDIDIEMGSEFKDCWNASIEIKQKKDNENRFNYNNFNEMKETESENENENRSVISSDNDNDDDELPPFYVKIIVKNDMVNSFVFFLFFIFHFCFFFRVM